MPTVSAPFGCSPTARVRSPPLRSEERELERDHDEENAHRDRPLVGEHDEDRPEERQVRDRVRKVERHDDAGAAESRGRDDEAVQVTGHVERGDIHHRACDDLIGSHRNREPRVRQTEQRADEHRHEDAECERRPAADRVVQGGRSGMRRTRP
jgi:hypothetical protein